MRDVQLVVDRQRKFKGLAYLELYRKEDVDYAIKLSGETLEGKELSITKSDAEVSLGSGQGMDSVSVPPVAPLGEVPLRLYIGNLDYGVNQDMIREMLLQFGPLDSVKLQMDETGKSKGHAFAQFLYKAHALAAFHQLNTTTLAGRQIRCDFTNDARQRDPNLPPSPPLVSSRTTYYPTSGSAAHMAPETAKKPANGQETLEDEFSNNSSMHSLIQRLAASTTNGAATITTNNLTTPAQAHQEELHALLVPQIDRSTLPSPGTPSTRVLLKNLFDPSTETDPNFDKEIEEEVRGEAESFGRVLSIHVDKNSFVRTRRQSCLIANKRERGVITDNLLLRWGFQSFMRTLENFRLHLPFWANLPKSIFEEIFFFLFFFVLSFLPLLPHF